MRFYFSPTREKELAQEGKKCALIEYRGKQYKVTNVIGSKLYNVMGSELYRGKDFILQFEALHDDVKYLRGIGR